VTGGGVTGGGVTGAGLRPAPVIDQRWAFNEAVNPIILLGDLTESSGQILIETCRALETKRGELDTVCSRSRLPSDSLDSGTVSMVSAIEGACSPSPSRYSVIPDCRRGTVYPPSPTLHVPK